ncbi:MAG: dipeptide epimerase [Saprospiraceae bacterium]|nr:dipeptide epimerase [Saprospiraceae bacterium]
MKIVNVRVWQENLELTRPYTIAYETIDRVRNFFVEVRLENGMMGIGAGSPADFVTGELFDESLQILQSDLEGLLKGRSIAHFYELLDRLTLHFDKRPAALAAVDIALYDALGQLLKVPIAHFLGKVHDGLPTSITIGIKSVEESLAEAKEYVERGFKIIKLKTGNEVEKDIEIFSKIRALVGRAIKIRVDANQGYDRAQLLQFVKAVESLDMEFMEQPMPADHLEEMKTLPRSVKQLCCADEDLHSPADAIKMAVSPQPYGIYNIKLMKCGGIFAASQISKIAEHSNIQLMWGCMDESIVSITAALHAAFASSATHYIDLDGSLDLARDIVQAGFILEDGYMRLAGGNGLGVERLLT